MKSCFAYIRVSTVKQGLHGVSLPEQRDAIAAYAARHQIKITQWFEERVTAATPPTRRLLCDWIARLLECRISRRRLAESFDLAHDLLVLQGEQHMITFIHNELAALAARSIRRSSFHRHAAE